MHTVDSTLERLDQMENERDQAVDQAVKRTAKIAQFIILDYEAILCSLRLSGSNSPEA